MSQEERNEFDQSPTLPPIRGATFADQPQGDGGIEVGTSLTSARGVGIEFNKNQIVDENQLQNDEELNLDDKDFSEMV